MIVLEQLLTEAAQNPRARLRWHVLRAFGVLPQERRARRLKDRDIVTCGLHMILDAGGFVPPASINEGFDEKKFEEMRSRGN